MDIKGYEGLYQVSNMGEVRSLARVVNGISHGAVTKRVSPAKVLKLLPFGKSKAYRKVALSKDGKIKQCMVHRLVAEAFIPNPYNKPHVNHKNEIGSDNTVTNLEWVTAKENINYGTHNLRVSLAQKGKPHLKGVLSPSYGLKRSAESREKMRQSALRRYGHA